MSLTHCWGLYESNFVVLGLVETDKLLCRLCMKIDLVILYVQIQFIGSQPVHPLGNNLVSLLPRYHPTFAFLNGQT